MRWEVEMIRVEEVIVVEGKYDKNTLSQVVDAVIIYTAGFGVFSNKDKLDLIRRMARAKGVIILTDSDAAGFKIRGYLRGAVEPGRVKNAYIPDVFGKEKRKSSPSREGKLGVEGMPPETLVSALRRAGATISGESGREREARITKADLYKMGLSGRPESARYRQQLLKKLELPERLAPNALLDVLNALLSRAEFFALFDV